MKKGKKHFKINNKWNEGGRLLGEVFKEAWRRRLGIKISGLEDVIFEGHNFNTFPEYNEEYTDFKCYRENSVYYTYVLIFSNTYYFEDNYLYVEGFTLKELSSISLMKVMIKFSAEIINIAKKGKFKRIRIRRVRNSEIKEHLIRLGWTERGRRGHFLEYEL